MPWRSSTIDLREPNFHALTQFRDWKKVTIAEGHSITIKPGETVMGRVYEQFRMPEDCAGKVEGRSSFARLGLAVHCTGDFINPGWEGYMPLQLSNAGSLPIRISPYFPICQIMLVPLSSLPVRSYGDTTLRSKYVNDDGGPSLWWRDARIKQLQEHLVGFDISDSIQSEIVGAIRFESSTVLTRFLRFVSKKKASDLEHADEVLERFAARETLRRLQDGVIIAFVPILAAGVISVYTSVIEALEGASLALVIAFVVSLFPAYLAYERREDGYFGRSELAAARKRPTI